MLKKIEFAYVNSRKLIYYLLYLCPPFLQREKDDISQVIV